jgi:DNA-binding NtrC family response regulator
MHDASPAPADSRAVDEVLDTLDRSLLLLDGDLRVLAGAAQEELHGRPAGELFAGGVLDEGGFLWLALTSGQARHGWRAPYRASEGGEERLVELSAAPLPSTVAARLGVPAASYALLLRRLAVAVAVDGATAPIVYHRMAARSRSLCRLFRRAEELGPRRGPVLVCGEQGSGKELLARALHAAAGRGARHGTAARRPFVPVHCAALPASLVESELFGHRRGAVRDASQDRRGGLETAAGGTLYLHQVGSLPPEVQRRLARSLAEGAFRRRGEERPRRLEARVVAASDVDLRQAVARGLFDAELLAILGEHTLHLPPLRHRMEDVEPAALHFLARAAARDGTAWELAPETLGVLLRHRWPGNVRELENALQHACTVAAAPRLEPEDLPSELLFDVTESDLEAAEADAAHGIEADLLAALHAHGWRRRETADALGADRTIFWRRLWDLGWVR